MNRLALSPNAASRASPNQALEQTRDSVLRYGERVGCELLNFFVPSVLCPNEGSPPLLFRDRAASTLIAIEIEMVPRLRLAARGQMASLL